jgi:hypothetical protein
MLKIRPYKASDGEMLCLSAVDETAVADHSWAAVNETLGPGYTGTHKGQIVCAAGIRLVRKGVGDAWLVMSHEAAKNKKATFRTVKTMLEILIEEFDLVRVRATSRIGFPASQRLLEHLGFKRMRTMTTGYYFYRRTK